METSYCISPSHVLLVFKNNHEGIAKPLPCHVKVCITMWVLWNFLPCHVKVYRIMKVLHTFNHFTTFDYNRRTMKVLHTLIFLLVKIIVYIPMWVVLHFANLSNVMSLWDVLEYLQWGFNIYYHERSLGCLSQRQH